jgi:hypothetical protein
MPLRRRYTMRPKQPASRKRNPLTRREAEARARRSPKFRFWGSLKYRLTHVRKSISGDTTAEEKHHTPAEVGAMWGLSVATIRRLFENEAGVLKVQNASGPTGRRQYKTLRIPTSVVARVHRRISA